MTSGAALEVLARMVAAQGGDATVIENPERLPARAGTQRDVLAAESGVVTRVEPRALGRAIIDLGGGRRVSTDRVLPDVGLEIFAKPGQRVARGDRLGVVHARSATRQTPRSRAVHEAIAIGDGSRRIAAADRLARHDGRCHTVRRAR